MPSSPTRRWIATGLVVGVCSWAALLLAIPYALSHEPSSTPQRAVSAVVYMVGGFVCHQLPERSFHLWEGQVPVCARCAALYWAAPFGLIAALGFDRKRCAVDSSATLHVLRFIVVASAVPTLATVAIEWAGLAELSNAARAVSAIPLGLSVAWVVGLFPAFVTR